MLYICAIYFFSSFLLLLLPSTTIYLLRGFFYLLLFSLGIELLFPSLGGLDTTAWRSSSADAGLADLEAMSAARQRPESQELDCFMSGNGPERIIFRAALTGGVSFRRSQSRSAGVPLLLPKGAMNKRGRR